ncbi:MAG: peptidoglycan DD-metalloendopeptidase family protein [Oscillospiraceae bacterium]|nr:peptidoglycan DD-metalloendopeptidase family protein [Oscillospiraceae bacterium]
MKKRIISAILAGAMFTTMLMFTGATERDANPNDNGFAFMQDDHHVTSDFFELAYRASTVEDVIKNVEQHESVNDVQVFKNFSDPDSRGEVQIFDGLIVQEMFVRVFYDDISMVEFFLLEAPHVTAEFFDIAYSVKTVEEFIQKIRRHGRVNDVQIFADSSERGAQIYEGKTSHGMLIRVFYDDVSCVDFEFPEENMIRNSQGNANHGFILPLDGMNLSSHITCFFDCHNESTNWLCPRCSRWWRSNRPHKGIDVSFSNVVGRPVRAVRSGNIRVRWLNDAGVGNAVAIAHSNGLTTMYAHMQNAPPSGAVNQGAVIGTVGSTGAVTGVHLHFEVRIGNPANATQFWALTARNPIDYLTNAPTFDNHGAFKIRNFGNGRYLHRVNNNIGSTVEARASSTSEAQNWIVNRVTGNTQFQIRGFAPINTTNGIGMITGTSIAGNQATMILGTSNIPTADTTITVESNVADGTVRFRRGSLTLGVDSNNNVVWQTNNASANAQKWVLEPHALNDSRGDVDGNGSAQVADSNLISNFVVNPAILTPQQIFKADVNRDGRVTIDDSLQISRFIIGLPNCFERTCVNCNQCFK